jgi:Spy/CpxP family protein refolding chaperone
MSRTLKLSLVCAGIFACGVVVGVVGARRLAPVHAHRAPPAQPTPPPSEGFGPQQLKRFSAELGLTEEQKVAIAPIMDKTGEELRQLRRESFRQTTVIIEAMEAAVSELLTPAQREKLVVLQAEQRARMKAKMEERLRRRGEGGERREGGDAGRRPQPLPEDGPPGSPPPDAPAAPAKDSH